MQALLYRSRARAGLLAADLNAIIEVAQQNNGPVELTGLLVYGDMDLIPGAPGEFVQWIEGPEAALDSIFEAIRDDDRHHALEVLARGDVRDLTGGAYDDRVFPSWSMGLVRLSELPATLSGFLDFVESWGDQTAESDPEHA